MPSFLAYPTAVAWTAAIGLAAIVVAVSPQATRIVTKHEPAERVIVEVPVPAPAVPEPPRPPPEDKPGSPAAPPPPVTEGETTVPTPPGTSPPLPPTITERPPVPPPPAPPPPPRPRVVKPHPPAGKKEPGWNDEFRADMDRWRCERKPHTC